MSTKIKKKPSKTARIAAKLVADSKLMAAAKTINDAQPEQELNLPASSPRALNSAKKLRPEKKRG
jgi:DTW domain-containing protein YfiP